MEKDRHIEDLQSKPEAWSMEELKQILRNKGVVYRESTILTTIPGITVISGGKASVVISSNFPEQTQIYATAHELGHLALRHQLSASHAIGQILDFEPGKGIPIAEIEADNWAAKFLVKLDVVESVLGKDFISLRRDKISKTKIRTIARRLHIPERIVQIYFDSTMPIPEVSNPNTWVNNGKAWNEV